MGRKEKISKENILNAAFEILKQEGKEAVNIKRIAKELGCSTQPIAWQFGSMESLRIELKKKVIECTNRKTMEELGDYKESANPVKFFSDIGMAYIDLVYDEPNLAEFLRLFKSNVKVSDILRDENHSYLIPRLSTFLNISEEEIIIMMSNMIIFVQGLCSAMLSEMITIDRERAREILNDQGARYISSYGIPLEKAKKWFEEVE